ncbi:MAG: hypothetical protein WA005_09505 [Candidatus Binataceae bacterium]
MEKELRMSWSAALGIGKRRPHRDGAKTRPKRYHPVSCTTNEPRESVFHSFTAV